MGKGILLVLLGTAANGLFVIFLFSMLLNHYEMPYSIVDEQPLPISEQGASISFDLDRRKGKSLLIALNPEKTASSANIPRGYTPTLKIHLELHDNGKLLYKQDITELRWFYEEAQGLFLTVIPETYCPKRCTLTVYVKEQDQKLAEYLGPVDLVVRDYY